MAQLCERHPDRAVALVLDDAVNDRGLAMTSSFSNMVLAGQCIGHLEELSEFGEVVGQMSETGERFLPAAAEIAAAITLLGCSRACFVGAGALRAVADESVAFLSSESRRRGYELDLLREMDRKHLGRVRAVVTARGDDDVSALADYSLSLNCAADFPDCYRPVLDVMLGQLIGLFASMRCGLKPDQPSPGGTITRVVAPIKLYS
jgi:tagatose-6-phosphate ketose/aldose isomerase